MILAFFVLKAIILGVIVSILTVRMIGNDEHYGEIGFGNIIETTVNTFGAAQLPAICEPDLVIKAGRGDRRVLEIDIDDVLVWDNRKWVALSSYSIDVTGADDLEQTLRAGITKDNTSDAGDGPVANTIAEGTRPGGVGAAVAGLAANPNAALMAGDEIMPYVKHFDFGRHANESNAAGVINLNGLSNTPINDMNYKPYQVNGVTCHYLMTAAHYWAWLVGTNLAATASLSVGAEVRRMSIDVEELFFDRAVLLSILDALVLTN